jgi:hypothetical protein
MKKHLIIILFFCCQFTNAQQISSINNPIKYIQEYYSSFLTGYDFNGKYVTISDNYKASFSDSIFTLTFDNYDKHKAITNQIITINLKDVVSIEPDGTDVVEIHDYETLIVPICGKLAFKTTRGSYNINIYYEVDADVEQTKIFKAFEAVIKYNNNKIKNHE